MERGNAVRVIGGRDKAVVWYFLRGGLILFMSVVQATDSRPLEKIP